MSHDVCNEGDSGDFGNINDEDFLLAELSDLAVPNSTKRTTPAGFEDGFDLKKTNFHGYPDAIKLAEGILQKI